MVSADVKQHFNFILLLTDPFHCVAFDCTKALRCGSLWTHTFPTGYSYFGLCKECGSDLTHNVGTPWFKWHLLKKISKHVCVCTMTSLGSIGNVKVIIQIVFEIHVISGDYYMLCYKPRDTANANVFYTLTQLFPVLRYISPGRIELLRTTTFEENWIFEGDDIGDDDFWGKLNFWRRWHWGRWLLRKIKLLKAMTLRKI